MKLNERQWFRKKPQAGAVTSGADLGWNWAGTFINLQNNKCFRVISF